MRNILLGGAAIACAFAFIPSAPALALGACANGACGGRAADHDQPHAGYGRDYRGDRGYDHRGFGLGAALAAGAIVGGAVAAEGGYGPYPDYDYQYDAYPVYPDEGPGYVEVAPQPGYVEAAPQVADEGNDAVAYCERTFRSYDPASGTYLGYDGRRHPCP